MGFDLFLAAVSIVAASIATWALLRLFPSSDARQAIPLRTDGGFADPSHTTDGGVTIDGKVTADGESASDIDGQPTDHLGKRLVIALILTIPTFVITLLALAKIAAHIDALQFLQGRHRIGHAGRSPAPGTDGGANQVDRLI